MEKDRGNIMFDLERFIKAQQSYCGYDTAFTEIKRGKKLSHWIWYIFPQLKSLGSSYSSVFYGIASLDEAKAYLRHDTLRERLIEISNALLKHDKDIIDIVGDIDALKICSSMTLFHTADESIESTTVFKGREFDINAVNKAVVVTTIARVAPAIAFLNPCSIGFGRMILGLL